jgi:TM2 domain-containing membrane protein YozV
MKRRIVAGLLALFLGGLGFHKFYLGKSKVGLLFLVFVWTLIPSIIGFVQGIYYLLQSDDSFLRAQGLTSQNSTHVAKTVYDPKADSKGVF